MVPNPVPPPARERLLATILFVEIRGYSTLVDQLEPGDMDQVAGALWAELRQVTTEYGGLPCS
ncbi:MAG: hypothetical protein ACK2TZ_03315, partial [Anaerolineales bacterium]